MNRMTVFCGLLALIGFLVWARLGIPTFATVSLVFGVVFVYRVVRPAHR